MGIITYPQQPNRQQVMVVSNTQQESNLITEYSSGGGGTSMQWILLMKFIPKAIGELKITWEAKNPVLGNNYSCHLAPIAQSNMRSGSEVRIRGVVSENTPPQTYQAPIGTVISSGSPANAPFLDGGSIGDVNSGTDVFVNREGYLYCYSLTPVYIFGRGSGAAVFRNIRLFYDLM